MNVWWVISLAALLLIGAALVAASAMLRKRGYTRWLGSYVRNTRARPAPLKTDEIHVLLCIADHYEPRAKGADLEHGARRVERWLREYPSLFARFRDSDGLPPRHTFFFPIEQYEPRYLDCLAELCRAGFGEVEVHLHHDRDTADNLRRQLLSFKNTLATRHGLLSRHKVTGEVSYAFIHGNWALCNCNPDGAWCGVNEELDILRQTGCFADFTFPSAPHPTQPPIVNSIYYAKNQPGRPRSHETGVMLGAGPAPAESLLLIQGPLLLDWSRRKWGLIPRLENGCLQASQPPSMGRLDAWLTARVQAPSRPDWFFVKVHAHGASEDAHDTLLGPPMVQFHEDLAQRARDNPRFHYHYVTAREMANLARSAEANFQGPVAEARNFLYVPAGS